MYLSACRKRGEGAWQPISMLVTGSKPLPRLRPPRCQLIPVPKKCLCTPQKANPEACMISRVLLGLAPEAGVLESPGHGVTPPQNQLGLSPSHCLLLGNDNELHVPCELHAAVLLRATANGATLPQAGMSCAGCLCMDKLALLLTSNSSCPVLGVCNAPSCPHQPTTYTRMIKTAQVHFAQQKGNWR